jgi:hypothetical protein
VDTPASTGPSCFSYHGRFASAWAWRASSPKASQLTSPPFLSASRSWGRAGPVRPPRTSVRGAPDRPGSSRPSSPRRCWPGSRSDARRGRRRTPPPAVRPRPAAQAIHGHSGPGCRCAGRCRPDSPDRPRRGSGTNPDDLRDRPAGSRPCREESREESEKVLRHLIRRLLGCLHAPTMALPTAPSKPWAGEWCSSRCQANLRTDSALRVWTLTGQACARRPGVCSCTGVVLHLYGQVGHDQSVRIVQSRYKDRGE